MREVYVEEPEGGARGIMTTKKIRSSQSPSGRFAIEIGTRIMLTIEGVPDHLKCTFLGMDIGNCLIIKLPNLRAVQHRLFNGAHVVLRFISLGKIYGFRSQVLGVYASGELTIVFISYPPQMETQNLRQGLRVDCYIPAKAKIGENEVEGFILDLSIGGLKFACKGLLAKEMDNYERGDPIAVSFYILGIEQLKTLHCTVRSVAEKNGKTIIGVAFAHLEDDVAATIKGYLDRVGGFLAEGMAE